MSEQYAQQFSINQPSVQGQGGSSGQDGPGDSRNRALTGPGVPGNEQSPISARETLSSASDGNPQSGFNAAVAEKQQELIKEFREGKITKGDAVLEAHNFIYSTEGDDIEGKKFAFKELLATLDSVEILADAARRRGQQIAVGFNNNDSGNPPVADEAHNRDLEELALTVTKRKRIDELSDADAESGAENSMGNDAIGKRSKLTSSDLPWHEEEVSNRRDTRSSCQKTQELLYKYERDPAWVRRHIIISGLGPPSIPVGEWDAIFRGTAVNLDAIFSSIHSVIPPKDNIARVGATEIRFNNPEASKHIRTASDWTTAWDDAAEAITVAFPHRAKELKEYGAHIRAEFGAKYPSSHPRIILYDVAIRNFVNGGQRHLLTDFHLFTRFHSAIIASDGVESGNVGGANSGSASGSSAKSRPSGKKARNGTEICDRFNDQGRNCPNTSTSCRYIHICKVCRSSGHGERDCVKGGLSSRGSA